MPHALAVIPVVRVINLHIASPTCRVITPCQAELSSNQEEPTACTDGGTKAGQPQTMDRHEQVALTVEPETGQKPTAPPRRDLASALS